MQILIAENKELNNCLKKYIDECEKLNQKLNEALDEIREKDLYIERFRGMVEAFEICAKARRS